MKISELMANLQRIQNEQGDIEVMFEDSEFGNSGIYSMAVEQYDYGHMVNRDEYIEYIKRYGLERSVNLEDLQSERQAHKSFRAYDGTNVQNIVVLSNSN